MQQKLWLKQKVCVLIDNIDTIKKYGIQTLFVLDFLVKDVLGISTITWLVRYFGILYTHKYVDLHESSTKHTAMFSIT